MNTEKSFIDQIVEQIQNTVRDMEDSGIWEEHAKAPEKAEALQAQETETPKNSVRKRDEP
ncbi:hypothetical protein Q4543_24145 [Salipiger sp. 1_MG-2023]|uniref:hypothetical protein n=1 Tax=Salipiger sp. 1_MG-2023 TaxID=3062665 RepID=UPI0026E30AF9|nr:hypothetical protein [Salipiger sp. 1_MG-2023]MDO6588549.1 hypothetical protein [Salipiger sp. 1_MG-2023]